jgi:hypothetical protein
MSLLSLPDWISVLRFAIAARPHPDAIASDTPETAKAVEKARLEYAAKLLAVISGAIWLAGKLADAYETAVRRITDLAQRGGAETEALQRWLAGIAEGRPALAGPQDANAVLPTAIVQNFSEIVLTLIVLTIGTRALVCGAPWRVAFGAALTVTMAQNVWMLLSAWAALQAIRLLPMLGQFYDAMERVLAHDSSAIPVALATAELAELQLLLPAFLALCVGATVILISQYRTFRALGMLRPMALLVTPVLILANGLVQYAANLLGMRRFLATLATV